MTDIRSFETRLDRQEAMMSKMHEMLSKLSNSMPAPAPSKSLPNVEN